MIMYYVGAPLCARSKLNDTLEAKFPNSRFSYKCGLLVEVNSRFMYK